MNFLPDWFRDLLASLVGLLLLGLLGVCLEGLAYGWLHRTNPLGLHRIADRHAWLGQKTSSAKNASGLHPLWGWSGEGPRRSPHRAIKDHHGFFLNDRGDTRAVDPSADVRIFVLGGSTVRGRPHPPDQSIPAHMERLLESRHGRNFNVINAGTGGWTAVNQLSLLNAKILPFFAPDAVVVLDGANDAVRSLRAGNKFRRAAEGVWESSDGSYLYDVQLESYRRQFQALSERPAFTLNQLLFSLGLRRYAAPGRYYTGWLLKHWLGVGVLDDPADYRRARQYWNRYSLDPATRRRYRRRLRDLSVLREALRKVRLPAWRRKVLQYRFGGSAAEEWVSFLRAQDRTMSLERAREYLSHPNTYLSVPTGQLERLSCREAPQTAQPYLRNVRSALRSARSHGVPLYYALQPSLVTKEPRTHRENLMLADRVGRGFFTRRHPYNSEPGLCWNRVFRRFFGRAQRGYRTLRRDMPHPRRLVDLTDLFASQPEPRYVDFFHYTRQGHRRIAAALVDRLEEGNHW